MWEFCLFLWSETIWTLFVTSVCLVASRYIWQVTTFLDFTVWENSMKAIHCLNVFHTPPEQSKLQSNLLHKRQHKRTYCAGLQDFQWLLLYSLINKKEIWTRKGGESSIIDYKELLTLRLPYLCLQGPTWMDLFRN